MEWLNYHHLLYFWVVAKEGSIARASKQLRLAHPTISAQIHQLERQLGQKLFQRKGRGLVLTEFGRIAQGYADEIFSLGREFIDTAKGRPTGRPIRLVVGVSDSLPKSIVYRMLEPIFQLEHEVWLIAREDRPTEAFLGELAMHTVDVVLTDTPAGPGTAVRAFNHALGECGTAVFASPELAKAHRRRFPMSLDGAPFILPSRNATLRRSLEHWFETIGVRPKTIAEVEDPALAKVLAEAGLGIIAVPDVIEKEILQRYNVRLVRRVADVRQHFYAISLERKIKHPAVAVICESARKDIFA